MKITTITELDALPIGSVILDIDGDAWQRRPFETRWEIASHPDRDLRFDAEYLPATVLHIPGRNLVQEAQADAWDEGHYYATNGKWGPGDNPYRNEAP